MVGAKRKRTQQLYRLKHRAGRVLFHPAHRHFAKLAVHNFPHAEKLPQRIIMTVSRRRPDDWS
jgi:hypothetical protein